MADIISTESSKAASFTSSLAAKGIHNSPGPFIGIVKNNVDPSRSGKLQVWISEMGGKADDPGSWLTVSYCTPFYGVTPPDKRTNGQAFATNPHSYGMWFVPPDIGVKVMVIFIDGNKYKGYWFGCIPEWPNMHMVPGLSAPVSKKGAFPVVEYNDADPSSAGSVNQFFARAATPHQIQQQIYTKQGLISDPLRGPGTSSAFRETPSRVFGISTPGSSLAETGNVSTETGSVENIVTGRKGGHTFVMDDGDAQGKNVQFKMRSSTGHTILMSDTGGFIYIINAAGTAWIEMDAQGSVNVYSGAQIQLSANSGINIDSKGAVKIHGKSIDIKSDGNVNIEGKDVNVKASGSAKVSGEKDVSLKGKKAYLTGDECASVSGGTHVDIGAACVKLGTSASKATAAGGATAPQNMPTKEPWSGHKGGSSGATQPTAQPSYASTAGLPGGTGPYSASSNFGSSNIQQNYAELPNDIGPTKYTTGFQGTQTGQASMYATSVNAAFSDPSPFLTGGTVANAVGNAVGAAVANSIFDTKTTDYRTIPATANFSYKPSGTYNATNNLQGGSVDTSTWTPTEKLNNPGKLAYDKTDARAIGNSGGFAVYNKPEDGIAQLVVKIQGYLNQPSLGSSDKNLLTVVAKLLNTTTTSGEVYYAVRSINSMTNINGTDFLNMTDPRICIAVTTAIIQYMQSHMIYTYDQMIAGCAMGLGVSATTFANSLGGGPTTTSNGYGSPGTSTYVPVTTPALVSGSGSSAAQILTSIGAGVVTNVVSKLVSGGINQVSAAVTGSDAVNSVFTGGGSIFSSGSVRTGVPDAVQNFQVGDISNIVGSRAIGGTTECVGIATGVFGSKAVGASSNWQGTGTGIIDSQGSVPVGTACATFNFNGNYGPPNSPGGASGQSHTVLITGYVDANKQPLPQDAYNEDGTVKTEYRGQIAGFQAAEQYNASGGVIRSQVYMNGAPGGTKNANNYQPIVANGQTLTAKVLPNQQATKDTPVGVSSGGPVQGPPDPNGKVGSNLGTVQQGPPNPADKYGIVKVTTEQQGPPDPNAGKSIDAKDVDAAKTTSTPEAGTTTAQPVKEGTNIQSTQDQITKNDATIAENQKISDTRSQDISSTNLQIQANADKAQVFRDQQTTIRDKQLQLSDDYAAGKISKSSYLQQDQALSAELQKAGNTAKLLETQNVRLEKDVSIYQQQKDLADAKVLDSQEQKTELQKTEIDQAKQLDSAEQAQTANSTDQTKQVDASTTATGEPEVNGPGKFTVNYKAPADNTPASNTGGGAAGDGTPETAISSRDTQTSVVTGQSGGATDQTNDMQGAVFKQPDPTEGNDMKGATFDKPEPRTITTTDDQGNTMTFTTNGNYGGGNAGDQATTNTPVSAETQAAIDQSVASDNPGTPAPPTSNPPVTGTSNAPGTGTASTGAQTTPQGTAATGGGALKC